MSQSMLHRLVIPAIFIVLWSSAFIATKFATDHAPPLATLAIRMLIVVFLLAGCLLLRHGVAVFGSANYRQWAAQGLVGLMIHCCYLGGVFVSVDRGMDVGLAALIVGLQPILTAWLAAWLFKERLTIFSVSGLILGIAGLYMVVESRFGIAGAEQMQPIAMAAITGSLLGISLATLLQKKVGQHGLMMFNTWLQYLFAATGFMALSLATEEWVFDWHIEWFAALAWMVFAISLGAIPLLMLMIRAGEATRVASLFYLVTPLTALMALLVFDEVLSMSAWLGMGLVVIGVALVVTPKEKLMRLRPATITSNQP